MEKDSSCEDIDSPQRLTVCLSLICIYMYRVLLSGAYRPMSETHFCEVPQVEDKGSRLILHKIYYRLLIAL